MTKKKIELEEGNIFSVKISEEIWTIAQLCDNFKLPNSKYTQQTLAFFNYKAKNEEQIINELNEIDLSKPFFITTINGHPIKNYGLNINGIKNVNYRNEPNFKNDISKSLGLYKNKSRDFEDIVASYFGVLPWDCFAYDNYMENALVNNFEKRDDVKYMRDYTIDELKEMLGNDNYRLNKMLEIQ